MSTTEVVCTQGAVISQGLSTIARAVTSDLLISQDLSIPCKARWLQARIKLYKRISPEQVWRYDIWTSASRGRAATATSGGALVGRPRKRVPTSDNNSLVCHCTIQGNTKAPALSVSAVKVLQTSPQTCWWQPLMFVAHFCPKEVRGIELAGEIFVPKSILQNDVCY